jgi:hypothetical protein
MDRPCAAEPHLQPKVYRTCDEFSALPVWAGWTAIVDRLTFGGNIIETGTDSYRRARARSQQIPA